MTRPTTKRITRTPGVQGGKPCIRGTRVRTKTVYKLYRDGWSMVRLLGAFPTLSPDQIVAAIEYEARRAGRKCRKSPT